MRRTVGMLGALTALIAFASVTPANAQSIRSHSLNASPYFFTPGQDPINLDVSSSWDTDSDCQFWYGYWCDPVEATIEIWGSNGFVSGGGKYDSCGGRKSDSRQHGLAAG